MIYFVVRVSRVFGDIMEAAATRDLAEAVDLALAIGDFQGLPRNPNAIKGDIKAIALDGSLTDAPDNCDYLVIHKIQEALPQDYRLLTPNYIKELTNTGCSWHCFSGRDCITRIMPPSYEPIEGRGFKLRDAIDDALNQYSQRMAQ